jgi:hypothetical protein
VNQHDHHDSGTSDELGRRAAAALLADVERRTDVDAALRRLHDGSATEVVPLASRIGDSGRDRRRMVWLGAAAAAVAVVGTVTVVAMRDDGPGRVVPASPDTVDGTAPDAPRNTTDATTVPDTTPTDTTDDTTPPSAPVTTTPAEETDPTTAVGPGHRDRCAGRAGAACSTGHGGRSGDAAPDPVRRPVRRGAT